ncbi:50S ribosomal protein L6 [Fulvivirga sp. 29W222]|uniref:Large ribosomal subunit protein uL6 n=1 Tax=Fulvivirga marina TaxID=2494733 RepID=A0A937FXT5_9BACT|nr:50S ribosomal protein L6 [Fulvivirga marina]MBL6446498.1 50S ribosomal protein L6 [Fulvivirga marina]
MSRIGKKPIKLASGISYTFDDKEGNLVVKGPKGELTQYIDPAFKLVENEGVLTVERPTEQKRHKALHGLYRSLINNMVEGVSTGYTKKLELVGVGYKATAQNNVLELSLGYSHSIFMAIPAELKVSAETEKGKNPIVTLEGNDKQLIGQVAAKIKALRPVEPYKGKGVRFVGEHVRRKAGKQAAK